MSSIKKYKINLDTLMYEKERTSSKSRFLGSLMFLIMSLALSCLYFWIFTSVLGYDLPKTAMLKSENAKWRAKIELMNRQLDQYSTALESFQHRDDEIYRSIFGMNEISPEVRNAGFGGVDRYAFLDGLNEASLLKKTYERLDLLTKKTCIQSKSFDELSLMAKQAGDMASCIPAVVPINPIPGTFRISSGFGYRADPISGKLKLHAGFDFACPQGNPIYVTGDGVVERVRHEFFGYGNSVVVNHGFGYKTRYAHMRTISVREGMKVRRGDCLGETGNTGKSTGPHLHYEVIYKGRPRNPANYFDLNLPSEEYSSMLESQQAQD